VPHSGPVFQLGGRAFDLAARTHIMGILNVTPDSFSDGGLFEDPGRAVDRGLEMLAEGADFIDVGGESTRPRGAAYGDGAADVPAEEELRRVIPVIRELVKQTSAPVSVDTTKSDVARAAMDAGACIVNDVSGFSRDPRMPEVVGRGGGTAVVMHMRGTPRTMQADTAYGDLFGEIEDVLGKALARGRFHGIRQMFVDPGIGFGKSARDNYRLIAGLGRFAALGAPILVGPSRKSFLAAVLDLPAGERLEGTLAAVTASILAGAHVVRVHDVRAVRRAAAVADAVRAAGAASIS
jgi:dihydropteroate synthase